MRRLILVLSFAFGAVGCGDVPPDEFKVSIVNKPPVEVELANGQLLLLQGTALVLRGTVDEYRHAVFGDANKSTRQVELEVIDPDGVLRFGRTLDDDLYILGLKSGQAQLQAPNGETRSVLVWSQ